MIQKKGWWFLIDSDSMIMCVKESVLVSKDSFLFNIIESIVMIKSDMCEIDIMNRIWVIKMIGNLIK